MLEKVESLRVEDMKSLTNRYLLDKPRVIVRVMPDASAAIEEDSEEEDEEDDFDLD